MGALNIHIVAARLLEKREGLGIRAVAKEIGVSPATLSRIERGYLPDLETFQKVCQWLDLDPNEVLGTEPRKATQAERVKAMVHFRKDKALRPETAEALGQLILAAQRALGPESE